MGMESLGEIESSLSRNSKMQNFTVDSFVDPRQFNRLLGVKGKMASSSSNFFILDNVEKLIELVEARPPLYMRDLKEYSDTALKKKLWQEICAELFPVWGELDDVMKTKYIQDTQKKWLNLRTCFSRELKLQKAVKAGLVPSKRRRYMYFQKLLFLLPTMKNIEIENNERLEDSGSEMDAESDSAETDSARTLIKGTPVRKITSMEPAEKKSVIIKENSNSCPRVFEDHTLPVLRPHPDEDTYFVLSLVPQLQSLTEDEKFEAKIEMLKLLREIKRKRDFNFPTVNIKEEEFSE